MKTVSRNYLMSNIAAAETFYFSDANQATKVIRDIRKEVELIIIGRISEPDTDEITGNPSPLFKRKI